MSIDYGTVDPETGEFDIKDRFASVGGFYHTLVMLGHMRPHLLALKEAEGDLGDAVRASEEWLGHFLGDNREAGDKLFSQYCEFTTAIAQSIRTEQEIDQETEDSLAALEAEPEQFDSDLRALFGAIVLAEEPIPPDTVTWFSFFCRGYLGVFLAAIQQFEGEADEDSIDAIRAADDCLRPLVEYAETLVERDQPLAFSA